MDVAPPCSIGVLQMLHQSDFISRGYFPKGMVTAFGILRFRGLSRLTLKRWESFRGTIAGRENDKVRTVVTGQMALHFDRRK